MKWSRSEPFGGPGFDMLRSSLGAAYATRGLLLANRPSPQAGFDDLSLSQSAVSGF